MKLRWSSFKCALAGIAFLLRTQTHARWHALSSLVVLALGIWLSLSRFEWLILLPTMALVWVAEALNTAIEQLGDAITLEKHPRIGLAKDVAAGGVLIAALFAVVVALTLFIPKLMAL